MHEVPEGLDDLFLSQGLRCTVPILRKYRIISEPIGFVAVAAHMAQISGISAPLLSFGRRGSSSNTFQSTSAATSSTSEPNRFTRIT